MMTCPPRECKKRNAGKDIPCEAPDKVCGACEQNAAGKHCSRRRPEKQESRPHPDLPKDNNYLNRRILKKKYTCSAI